MPKHRSLEHRRACATLAVLFLSGVAGVGVQQARSQEEAVTPQVIWLNYREAKATARHQDRPLMVFFTAARSAPAARLDREVWTDRRVRRYLDAHLVVARVDLQHMPAVARLFDVAEAPAVLFLAPDGKRLVVLRGFHGPESLLRVATYVGSRAWEYADYETWVSRNKDN